MSSNTAEPRRIDMFPDYSAELPLWGDIDWTDPGLSEALIARLRDWNDEWQNHPPEVPRPWSERQWREWRRRGHRLAGQVQAELDDVEVWVNDRHGHHVPVRRIWGHE